MKNILRLLLLAALAFARPAIAYAQNTSSMPTVCGPPDRGKLSNVRYQNLDAVGLLISNYPQNTENLNRCRGKEDVCARDELEKTYYKTLNKIYSPAIQIDNIINIFSKRIREQIFPFLNADANCRIPDLAIFKIGSGIDEIYLEDFMKVPNRLLIVVQVRYVGERNSAPLFWQDQQKSLDIIDKYGPPVALMTMQYFRSGSRNFDIKNDVWDEQQVVIPLSLPDDEISKRLGWFASNILVWSGEHIEILRETGGGDKHREEVLKNKPPTPMIPQPQVLPQQK